MDEIYRLVGQLIYHFQIVEQHISLLVYKKSTDATLNSKSRKDINSIFNDIYNKTFGHKLNKIKRLNILDTNTDTIVLEYIKNKRNYIVHNFFTENSFNTITDIDTHTNELTQILHDTEIVATAIELFICNNTF